MTTVERIVAAVPDKSARGIAAAVAKLVTEGHIAEGERMPTTRILAKHLEMSAAAVSDAWKILAADGVLETRGRLGTFVGAQKSALPWRQFRGIVGADLAIDLSTGFPDPELLVDLRPYLAKLAQGPRYLGYPSDELDPLLADELRKVLPFPPTAENTLLATHIIGALSEMLPVVGGPSTRVIVADPEFAPYLDLLERYRMEPVPLPMDDEGMVAESFGEAVCNGAKAAILQPRLHNPTGVVTSRRRLQALAEICAEHDVWILEGDFYGDLSPAPAMSAGEWAPQQTVYMKSFSKDIHPDIRVAALVGAPALISAAHRRRVGGFNVSRINQDLLRLLLQDGARQEQTTRVRKEYQRRQSVFLEILAGHGIHVRGGGGFNVWVPVRSESDALVYLATKGIGVAPGSAFQVRSDKPHVRVSTAAITTDIASVATEIAIAARVGRSKAGI
jgi:DNA-binding transcriptional MocR family regulator